MIKQLTKLATHLDKKGHRKEADFLDSIITKMAEGSIESWLDRGINYPGDIGNTMGIEDEPLEEASDEPNPNDFVGEEEWLLEEL